ncbi:efflux RND transporter periplasmic adaptor subunit [bacterium]|nr:efflux RND transporter periplasmic adaptor subunit [bacterium]
MISRLYVELCREKRGMKEMSFLNVRRHGAIVLALAALCCVCFAAISCSSDSESNAGENDALKQSRVRVVQTPISKRTFERRVVVQGNLEAKNVANVSARVGGTIDAIFVDEGDFVVAGKTKLFQVDSLNLRHAVDVRRQGLAVARCSVREAQAGLEQVDAQLEKADRDLLRYERLHKSNTVSSDAFEKVQSLHKQIKAAHKHSESLVDLQKERVRQAEIALSIAEKNLSDSLAYAPIDGTVSKKYYEVGEMPEKGKPVLRIEDTSVIEASAFLPDQFYADVRPGETVMSIRVGERDVGHYKVSYRSPTVDLRLRTFEVKCSMVNPPAGVVPGAMADISTVLERIEGLGVPLQAVQHRGDNDVIFVIGQEMARSVKVETGLQTDGYVLLKNCSLTEGTPVVVQGQSFLSDGSPVKVLAEGN